MVSQSARTFAGASTSREAILHAATEVFMEAGLSGARVDEIARRARANKAMIYYHFGSKQGLYRTVLLRLFEALLAEIARLRASSLGPKEKLRALYTRIAGHFSETRALPQIMLREILAGGSSMDAESSRALLTIISFVGETLRKGDRAGRLPKVEPLLLHLTMMGPLLLHSAGALFRERLLTQEMPGLNVPSDDDMLAHLLGVLERSLQPPNGRPSLRQGQRLPPRKPR